MEVDCRYDGKEIDLRETIRKMFFGEDRILLEKTFAIQDDVEYIWERGFVSLLDYYKNNPKEVFETLQTKDIVYLRLSSSKLPSSISQSSSLVNPVEIDIGIMDIGNTYSPSEKNITLSINSGAVLALGPDGLRNLPNLSKTYPQIGQEFSKEALCGSIAHELAHWLDETNHDGNVTRHLNKMNITSKTPSNIIYFNYATNQEIDANIHALHDMKRQIGDKKWDTLTFEDVLKIKPSMKNMFTKVKEMDDKMYKKWRNRFFGRMNREGLIGSNMR